MSKHKPTKPLKQTPAKKGFKKNLAGLLAGCFLHRYVKLILCVLCLQPLALSSALAAKQNNEPPRYAIEVVVFESLALRGWTEEYWPESFALPNLDNTTALLNRQTPPLLIQNTSQQLQNAADKLSKKGYRVLFHQAWSQLAVANKQAPKVFIEAEHPYGTHLLGTVRLYKTRFAHVEFDLELHRRIPQKIQQDFAQHQGLLQSAPAESTVQNANNLNDGEFVVSKGNQANQRNTVNTPANSQVIDPPEQWSFAFKSARKMRDGELHYIDHPLFGILVQVKKL